VIAFQYHLLLDEIERRSTMTTHSPVAQSPVAQSPVAIVTGASRGLGLALTRRLTDAGWRVVVDARDADALEHAVHDIAGVTAVPGDVTDADHRRALADAATALGPLRLVVANGGTLGPSPLPRLADAPLDALRDTFGTNTVAQLGLAQATLPRLRESGGTLALITSDAAVEGYPGWGVYGASKAALEAIGRVLAAEEPDVRVLVVDPGDLRTEMHQAAFPGEDISDRPWPEEVTPGLVALFEGDRTSGRYRAAEVAS
jgi:NAD(P)-dependent dehydrogenase (short-subunit alcohol dehydrogenase family)